MTLAIRYHTVDKPLTRIIRHMEAWGSSLSLRELITTLRLTQSAHFQTWKCNIPMNPHGHLGRSVSVCHNFLKEREVTLPCSYRSTCLNPYTLSGADIFASTARRPQPPDTVVDGHKTWEYFLYWLKLSSHGFHVMIKVQYLCTPIVQ